MRFPINLATRPTVRIRILLRDFRFPENVPPFVTGFEVLDEALVIVDSLTGFTTYRRTEEVAVYTRAFDAVFGRARPPRFGKFE
jgi:hypothetical protein